MEAATPVAAAPLNTSDFKEHALLKELMLTGSDFKFSIAPTQHRLKNIKLLPTWFDGIVKMLERAHRKLLVWDVRVLNE